MNSVLSALLLIFILHFPAPFSCPCSERLVLAVTDWPAPLSLPWLPVSGPLVSVWVSSCRLFVDCTGRRRGGGVGVGVRRTADSCYGLGLTKLFTALHFSTGFWRPPLPVEILLDDNSHTLLSVLLFPFVLCPHSNHSLSLPSALFISSSFYFSTAALHCFPFLRCFCCGFFSLFVSLIPISPIPHFFSSDLTPSAVIQCHRQSILRSVVQKVSQSDSCPCGQLFRQTSVSLSPWLRHRMATGHW